MNSPESNNHKHNKSKPHSRSRRAASKVALTATLILGTATAAEYVAGSLDTSHHSAEVKQDLQETLKPVTEDLGRKLLNFAISNVNNPAYSVSVFERETENENVLTDTSISYFVNDGSFESTQEFTVTVDSAGEVVGISGSEYSSIDEEPLSTNSGFNITSSALNDSSEWGATARSNGTRQHTGDQGLVGDSVGDKRTDTERAVDITQLATDMINSFVDTD